MIVSLFVGAVLCAGFEMWTYDFNFRGRHRES